METSGNRRKTAESFDELGIERTTERDDFSRPVRA